MTRRVRDLDLDLDLDHDLDLDEDPSRAPTRSPRPVVCVVVSNARERVGRA